MQMSRGRIIALAVLGVLVLAMVGVGVYGLIVGPRDAAAPTRTEPPGAPATAAPSATPIPLVPIAHTSDAERFAESVAHAIFDWSTQANILPGDIVEHVLAFGDPTGFETNGLYADLTTYLPTREQWSILREYGTAQSLEIRSLGVPESWAAIAANPANEIAPGTVAVTVEGIRTRTGGWDGEQTTKVYSVEFTMFLACPDDGTCSLLRLSNFGQALR